MKKGAAACALASERGGIWRLRALLQKAELVSTWNAICLSGDSGYPDTCHSHVSLPRSLALSELDFRL